MFRYFARPALIVCVVALLCVTSLSCSTEKQGAHSEELAGRGNCGTWKNPELKLNLSKAGDNPDLQNIPEGLTLLDGNGNPTSQLDCSKDTVIYIHGLIRDGGAPRFENVNTWNKKFNTLIFRWHRLSYDPRMPPQYSYDNIPKGTSEFIAAYRNLYAALGSDLYNNEIRFVGYSFGGNIATSAANLLFKDSMHKPRRLELLDPGFLEFDVRGFDAAFGRLQSPYELNEVGNQLFGMTRFGVKVAVYSTSISSIAGRNLKLVTNVQRLSSRWQGGDLEQAHKAVVPYYFGSLNAPRPSVTGISRMPSGFSAAYPTEAWPTTTVSLKQSEGMGTTGIGDDMYEPE